MPCSRSRSICSFAGELARPSLAVEPGSTEARIFTVSRYMSRVFEFEETAVVTSIKGSNHAGPEVSALP
jgi:hypothetical protein